MWHRDVAELVRDDVVDGIHRRLDQPAIKQQARCRRHRTPTLPKLADDQALGAKVFRGRETQKIDFQTLGKFCMSALPIPMLDRLPGDLGSLGSVRLDDDEATDELYPRLDVGHHLQPILASEVEMSLARHVLAIRGARKELDEVSLLTPDPGCTLAYLLFDHHQRGSLRSSDDNGGIRLDSYFQCRPFTAHDGEVDSVFTVLDAVSFGLHPGNRARARSMILSSRSSITSTGNSMPRSSRRTSKK